MRTTGWLVGCVLAALPAHAAGPSLGDLVLARDFRDGKPVGVRTEFAPSDRRIVCVAEVKDLARIVTLTATLTAVEIGTVKNRKLLDQKKEIDPKKSGKHADVTFTFTLPRDWPKGKYRIDVTLGKSAAKPLPFEIK